ncbi:hypothetical protein [Sciscionella sediminilitoris]|uniref:hypothetical protein n=1 Tax=Sciscionella sediminilitoris TaxID=1445613 RepID=UPI0004DEF900|nr:hypothetical protein [Sciscionella sp. SE31]
MGWNETHRYYAALREVTEELERSGEPVLPWRAEYAEIFGDRRGLLLALRRRWELLVQAQVEPFHEPDRRLRELGEENSGLLRLLRRHAAEFAAPAPTRITARRGLGGVA